MIKFGTTFILFETYFEQEEKFPNMSTKTKSKASNIFKHAFLKATKEPLKKTWMKKKLKTVGDMASQPCMSLAIYSKEIYIRKQYIF